MNPEHTHLQAAQAEVDRFDRIIGALGDTPVNLAAHLLREPLTDLLDITQALEEEAGRLADLLLDNTERPDPYTDPTEVF